MGEIKLIVRGDDFGMSQGSLVAFEKAFKEGILTCASVLMVAPWFEGAIELFKKNPWWCIGVHLALVGEWQGYRWRPVLPWDKIPSLVDEDGFLYGNPDELWAKKPKLEEIEAELRAQVMLAKRRGLRVDYVDTHYMGFSSYPGLEKIIIKIADEFKVPLSGMVGERRLRGVYKVPIEKKHEEAIKMLEELKPGLWLWVNHPGVDSLEHNALVHTKKEDIFSNGGVGKHRAEETRVLTSPEIKNVIKHKGIILTSYKDLKR